MYYGEKQQKRPSLTVSPDTTVTTPLLLYFLSCNGALFFPSLAIMKIRLQASAVAKISSLWLSSLFSEVLFKYMKHLAGTRTHVNTFSVLDIIPLPVPLRRVRPRSDYECKAVQRGLLLAHRIWTLAECFTASTTDTHRRTHPSAAAAAHL